MQAKYLKKKKLYKRATMIIKETLPLCKEFTYSFFRGTETISGGSYKIYSQFNGDWIKVTHKHYNEAEDAFFCTQQIFAKYIDGKYQYVGNIYSWHET